MIHTWAKPGERSCHRGLGDHPLRNVAAEKVSRPPSAQALWMPKNHLEGLHLEAHVYLRQPDLTWSKTRLSQPGHLTGSWAGSLEEECRLQTTRTTLLRGALSLAGDGAQGKPSQSIYGPRRTGRGGELPANSELSECVYTRAHVGNVANCAVTHPQTPPAQTCTKTWFQTTLL